MPVEIFNHLPSQWMGFFAVAAFVLWAGAQVVEKYPLIAKHVPLGKWWHNRQKRRFSRRDLVAEDNEVIAAMQLQISAVVQDLAKVNEKLRVFTAFSVYDARYHHRIEVAHADGDCAGILPKHHGFFEFEHLWQTDPVAAATL